MKKCAFLTLEEQGDFVIDDIHAVEPMARLGWQASIVSWRQTGVPWSDYDAVIIRSTWDYWNDVDAFLDVLWHINRATRLANPLDLVHWNLSKTYMRDLEQQGVPIVLTEWLDTIDIHSFFNSLQNLGSSESVIKPVIGANGQDAYRISPEDPPERIERIIGRFRNRPCMVQRFMPCIVREGEFSLFFFNGEFSHATLRIPAESEFRSQEERGARVELVDAEDLLLRRGRQALATMEPPLYARIDFVRDDDGDFRVMEMELIEPSLYLRMDPEAPMRFAHAIDDWYGSE
jgi:glutathione synthase/RimK-type ligase-like ATP-grasp enzyme